MSQQDTENQIGGYDDQRLDPNRQRSESVVKANEVLESVATVGGGSNGASLDDDRVGDKPAPDFVTACAGKGGASRESGVPAYSIEADIEAMAEAIYKKMNSTGIGAAVVATPYHQLSKYSKRTFIMYSKAALAASPVHAELEKLQADVMCALRTITEYDTGLALAKAENERLREALVFYSDQRNVCVSRSTFEQYEPSEYKQLGVDGGFRAKQALQQKGGE